MGCSGVSQVTMAFFPSSFLLHLLISNNHSGLSRLLDQVQLRLSGGKYYLSHQHGIQPVTEDSIQYSIQVESKFEMVDFGHGALFTTDASARFNGGRRRVVRDEILRFALDWMETHA